MIILAELNECAKSLDTTNRETTSLYLEQVEVCANYEKKLFTLKNELNKV
jgi:macrodomain Ter protein organizer (MatP/YcbG family)